MASQETMAQQAAQPATQDPGDYQRRRAAQEKQGARDKERAPRPSHGRVRGAAAYPSNMNLRMLNHHKSLLLNHLLGLVYVARLNDHQKMRNR